MRRVLEGSRPPHMLSASSSNSAEGGLVVEVFGPASPDDVDGALVKDFLGLDLEVFLGLVAPPVVAVVLAEPVAAAEPLLGPPSPSCCTASPPAGLDIAVFHSS